jgi:3-keto-disaccharide hydrolase
MQRLAVWLTMVGALLLLGAGDSNSASLSFKDAKIGELPKGWTAAKTGTGEGSVWKIVADETSPDGGKALAQVSDKGAGSFFNLCVADDTSYKDLDLAVSFNPVAGKQDQGGGPVWRYKDANNYYIARMNPLEDNFRVYKVVDGKRMQLGTADVSAEAGKWHTIRITHQGDRIVCYLNGKSYLDVKDGTFKDAGKVGLWTKADAQTRFAGIKVEALK